MALPKKKTDLVLNPPKPGSEYLNYGMERIEQLMLKTDKRTNYLPKSIGYKDIDQAAFDFVNNKDMKIVIDGKDVPVIFLTNERWAEFSKTWQYTDLDKNLITPFITVMRTSEIEGTRLGKRWNVAQNRVFKYIDVPILDEGQVINLRFKIPQPVNRDLTYDVRLFTKYQTNVNVFDEKTAKTFASRQAYVWIKGNPMPIIHESESSQGSTVQDTKGDRMYVKQHTLKILGFIQSEEDFQITKTTRLPNIGISVVG